MVEPTEITTRPIRWLLILLGLLFVIGLGRGAFRQSPAPESGSYTVIAVRFADMETPTLTSSGALTLKNKPNPPQSLQFYRNGLLMTGGVDYTISNTTMTLTVPTVAGENEKFVAWYRY
jgi:hypothetical protein